MRMEHVDGKSAIRRKAWRLDPNAGLALLVGLTGVIVTLALTLAHAGLDPSLIETSMW